jgi:predicted RNA-binding protein YlxR (DUF448 family)
MPEKKLPVRQCAACREHRAKRDLLRVVRVPTGEISIDTKGKVSGRGAYICADATCLAKAKKSRALERHLKSQIPQEVFTALEAAIADGQ